jgi:hypothetical protein
MTQAIIEDNLSAQEASVIDIRALIMSPAFENAARFYQMFSTDVTYYGDQILVEGKKISRVTMSSVVDLLNALKKQLLAGEKHFLIACHGSPEGLLIRAAPGHTTTLTDKILDRLLAAADDETGARDTLLGTTDKSGKKLFTKESQVDDLLSLIKDVRGGQIELIEFRCCNLGAGAGLKKIHKLFGSKITAAPKTKYVFLRGTFGGKAKLPKSEAQWNAQLKHNADQIGRLPPNRRTFTRDNCNMPFISFADGTEVVAGLAVTKEGDINRYDLTGYFQDWDAVKGWTQVYLENSFYYPFGRTPPGGGFSAHGTLYVIGFYTPDTPVRPFVFAGDGFGYTERIAYEMG